ncbi:phosphoserine phosphatase SerB [Nocardioidaceae bacterium]|nr:phosphoserine phosphatase SerB [Nocardioidaceae bacterium]
MTATAPSSAPGPALPTLLITLTGRDRPGVTAQVFGTLAAHGCTVLDVEQVVIRGRLVLGVLVTPPAGGTGSASLEQALAAQAAELGLEVELEQGSGDAPARGAGRTHVTVLGQPLAAAAVAAIVDEIATTGANIDRIARMARYPVTALELSVSGVDPARLRELLTAEGARQQVDVAVQPADLLRRGRRLIVMDVDSTLVRGEVIEMLAERAGCLEQVADVTERAMRGELDFEESLRERVALLEGLPASALDEVYESIELSPGARTLVRTLKRLGYRFAIVSGGFSHVTDRLAEDLGIDLAEANELEILDGRLTGRLLGRVVDRARKAEVLREFAAELGVPPRATVAIGDGANDLDMLSAAGLGVAFNAKPVVREAADTAVNVPYLDTVLYLLGISREEVEAADADDGYVGPTD